VVQPSCFRGSAFVTLDRVSKGDVMEKTTNVEVNESSSAKKIYKSPKVVDYGSVSEITAGAVGVSVDVATSRRAPG
jgi:hypothetical protein